MPPYRKYTLLLPRTTQQYLQTFPRKDRLTVFTVLHRMYVYVSIKRQALCVPVTSQVHFCTVNLLIRSTWSCDSCQRTGFSVYLVLNLVESVMFTQLIGI